MSDKRRRAEVINTASDAILLALYLLGGIGFWFVSSGGLMRAFIGLAIDVIMLRGSLRIIGGSDREQWIQRIQERLT